MPGQDADDIAAREAAWERYPNDAREVDPEARPSHCQSAKCNLKVWRGYTAAGGKVAAFDIKPDGTYTGTNHWRTCRDRQSFQRPRR